MTDLRRALERLEFEVLRPADPPKTVVTSTPVRDADHRIEYVIVESSTGERWKKTPARDAEHRITRVVTEQLPESA